MAFIGKAVHIGVDLVLVSTALAGLKRSTGWSLKTNDVVKDSDYRSYLQRYLDVGEWTLDFAKSQMAQHPEWFEKSR
ncbi:hypothetical protein H4219_000568 [Mycoemilia scoparia]|uniref:DUF1748-domain-containing protein n=1 Tax=Mycoemilia scoparia TaxID=417184 RepID=A0A9W8DWT0_9FUNG|nr:hypothetical protein H4219_000568 [Mycoemilia scoparia]